MCCFVRAHRAHTARTEMDGIARHRAAPGGLDGRSCQIRWHQADETGRDGRLPGVLNPLPARECGFEPHPGHNEEPDQGIDRLIGGDRCQMQPARSCTDLFALAESDGLCCVQASSIPRSNRSGLGSFGDVLVGSRVRGCENGTGATCWTSQPAVVHKASERWGIRQRESWCGAALRGTGGPAWVGGLEVCD